MQPIKCLEKILAKAKWQVAKEEKTQEVGGSRLRLWGINRIPQAEFFLGALEVSRVTQRTSMLSKIVLTSMPGKFFSTSKEKKPRQISPLSTPLLRTWVSSGKFISHVHREPTVDFALGLFSKSGQSDVDFDSGVVWRQIFYISHFEANHQKVSMCSSSQQIICIPFSVPNPSIIEDFSLCSVQYCMDLSRPYNTNSFNHPPLRNLAKWVDMPPSLCRPYQQRPRHTECPDRCASLVLARAWLPLSRNLWHRLYLFSLS